MTYDEKVKWVRQKIHDQEQLNGFGLATYSLLPVAHEFGDDLEDAFSAFLGTPSKTKTKRESVIVLTVNEQIEILKRLEKDNFIKILKLDDEEAKIEVCPPLPCPIKLKTLQHIAKELANIFSGSNIVDILLDYGIPRCDIPYPNTKWRTLEELFLGLATSPNEKQRAKFGGAITTFLHPLNFNADESASQKLIEDFNKYLRYDGYEIVLNSTGEEYELVATGNKSKIAKPNISPTIVKEKPISFSSVEIITDDISSAVKQVLAENDLKAQDADYSNQEEYETNRLREPEAADQLSIIREAYKTLMAITSLFCTDPTTPSRELNNAYTELSQLVSNALNNFCGDTSDFEVFSFGEYEKNNFGIPFSSLYRAELEFKDKGKKMQWDEIRPEMNAVLGQIEEVCSVANASEIISDPKIQTTINNAMLLLSQIAAGRKDTGSNQSTQTMKLEITKMPELQVRNVEESVISKGKKHVTLPKFKPTDWAKITIRFINDQNVLITADKKQIPTDYVGLGFADNKRDKPNRAWKFFLELAKNGGATKVLPVPIPDNIKQLKKQLSDRLKVIFKNDTDPFFDSTEDHIYRIKINLLPPITENAPIDILGTKEYLEEMMVEVNEE